MVRLDRLTIQERRELGRARARGFLVTAWGRWALEREWQRLCAVIGLPPYIQRPTVGDLPQ